MISLRYETKHRGKAERNASSKRTKLYFCNIRERHFPHNYASQTAKLDLKRAQEDVVSKGPGCVAGRSRSKSCPYVQRTVLISHKGRSAYLPLSNRPHSTKGASMAALCSRTSRWVKSRTYKAASQSAIVVALIHYIYGSIALVTQAIRHARLRAVLRSTGTRLDPGRRRTKRSSLR